MQKLDPEKIISLLNLEPLDQEGGYFCQTYLSKEKENCSSSAIYYLITQDQFSHLHRLKNDEIFHFYLGDPVEQFTIDSSGKAQLNLLGPNLLKGEKPQIIIPAGTWQGAKLGKNGVFALMGSTMTPAFSFDHFELADRNLLSEAFPHSKEMIRAYCH